MRDSSGSPPSEGPPEGPPPPELRFLKALVVALTAVMIGGIVVIVALLALRLPGGTAPPPLALPAGIVLPEGARPEAVAFGRDWLVVLTEGGEALVYDRDGGALRNRVELLPAE